MHLTEDDLVLHYYGELEQPAAARTAEHLRECPACNASFTTLQRVLAAVDSMPPLEVGDGFERKTWARLQPELDGGSRKGWRSWFLISPARLAWVAGIASSCARSVHKMFWSLAHFSSWSQFGTTSTTGNLRRSPIMTA